MWLASLLRRHHRPHDGLHHRHRDATALATELWLAFAALAICLRQFKVGAHAGPPLRRRSCGRTVSRAEKHGPRGVDGPVVPRPDLSIAPTAYIVWQNFVNSYQIWRKDRGK